MAVIVVSDLGEAILLDRATGRVPYSSGAPDVVHLYTNDYTPDKNVELADVTECVASGYSPKDLTGADWQEPTHIDGRAVTRYDPPALSWLSASGSVWCYGYFVTNNAEDVLLWASRFESKQLLGPSSPVVVNPVFGGVSINQPEPP